MVVERSATVSFALSFLNIGCWAFASVLGGGKAFTFRGRGADGEIKRQATRFGQFILV